MSTGPARTRAVVTVLAVSLLLAACGSSSGSSSQSSSASPSATSAAAASSSRPSAAGPTPASKAVSVAITNYAFHPPSLTVAPGAKVTFTNHDQTAHTATGRHGAFDTGTLKPGENATVTLKKPGTYTLYCQFHAFMTATILVK
jgi:plastocyanin